MLIGFREENREKVEEIVTSQQLRLQSFGKIETNKKDFNCHRNHNFRILILTKIYFSRGKK